MFEARDASCDNLHLGIVHLVRKTESVFSFRKCTQLNKTGKVIYYNIHHRGGVILGARRSQVVGVYTPVA